VLCNLQLTAEVLDFLILSLYDTLCGGGSTALQQSLLDHFQRLGHLLQCPLQPVHALLLLLLPGLGCRLIVTTSNVGEITKGAVAGLR